MIGQATSAKMREKLKGLKRRADDDDDVKSSDSHGTFDGDENAQRQKFAKQAKKNALLDDPFLLADEEPRKETAEEKKLRLAKEIIAEYASEQKNDFFDSLFAKTQADYQIVENEDDQLTRRMKMHLLEQQGKLFYNVANDYTGFAEFEKDSVDDSV